MDIVFLDFDGVLVNKKSWYDRSGRNAVGHPICVKAFNRLLEVTGCEIVISSSWRIGSTLVELNRILKSWGVTKKAIGTTPPPKPSVVAGIYIAQSRGEEIAEWMKVNPGEHRIVILDDDRDIEPLARYHIHTFFDVGLTERDVDRAIALFEAQRKGNYGPIRYEPRPFSGFRTTA